MSVFIKTSIFLALIYTSPSAQEEYEEYKPDVEYLELPPEQYEEYQPDVVYWQAPPELIETIPPLIYEIPSVIYTLPPVQEEFEVYQPDVEYLEFSPESTETIPPLIFIQEEYEVYQPDAEYWDGPSADSASPPPSDEFPFLAMIQTINILDEGVKTTWCAGSILSEKWILTSATCLGGKHAQLVVRIGNHTENRQSFFISAQKYKFPHKYYNPSSKINDIALIKIPRRQTIKFDNGVQKVQLVDRRHANDSFAGETSVIATWDKSFYNLFENPDYSLVDLKPIENDQCNDMVDMFIRDGQICATPIGMSSSVSGMGGPLMASALTDSGESLDRQIGIFNEYISDEEDLIVFIRVSKYLNWIKGITNLSV